MKKEKLRVKDLVATGILNAIIIVLTLVIAGSAAGAVMGRRLLKKHFEKAGIV